jgi:hypothetical protein
MKQFLLIYLLLLPFAACIAQQSTTISDQKIDPRQYVTVQYHKTPTQGRMDTIWNWEQRSGVPNQKISFIDVDGEIKIDFSQLALISNINFEGTVSLEAEISGANGTRKIEVNPYSEIGVQRIPIGIKSEPPSEIAKKLLNMIRELENAEQMYDKLSGFKDFTPDDVSRQRLISSRSKIILDKLTAQKELTDELMQEAKELELMIGSRSPKKIDTADTKKEVLEKLKYQLRLYEDRYKNDRANCFQIYQMVYGYTSKNVDIVLEYLNSFESGGEDATKAFLSLINKDLVGYKALKTSFISAQKKLQGASLELTDDYKNDSLLAAQLKIVSSTCKSLVELSRFKGSAFESILQKVASTDPELSIDFKTLKAEKNELREKQFYFDLINTHLQQLSEELSLAAGKMIYKKLVYATIDLGKSGAKNGEVLNVYVTWILDSKKDSLANSPRLPIGKYYLRETGWKTEVSDMFALIKRVKESSVNQTNVSPTNFKGSGGAVLMWTFNKADKGLKITEKRNEQYSVKRKNRFINFLEPSIGLNVSYLDFSTEKDVEIGTGLQLGLFKNKIFFGYGVNLHMISPQNQAPTYYYVGFSFAKLSDLFKSSNNVTSTQ